MTLKPFVVKKEITEATANPHLSVVTSILQTPNDQEVTWSYIKTNDAVFMFALDDKQNVYLKREWRLNIKDFIWELPAGFIEEENPTDEQIQSAANRELQEEIGVKAAILEKIITVRPSNYLTMTSHIFLAKNFTESKLKEDEHEYLEVKKLPIKDAYDLITKNQIPGTQTLIAFEIIMKKLNLS
ncbi:NUDIX hydrolase [soil metagenome]